jgi:hypothetical protein
MHARGPTTPRRHRILKITVEAAGPGRVGGAARPERELRPSYGVAAPTPAAKQTSRYSSAPSLSDPPRASAEVTKGTEVTEGDRGDRAPPPVTQPPPPEAGHRARAAAQTQPPPDSQPRPPHTPPRRTGPRRAAGPPGARTDHGPEPKGLMGSRLPVPLALRARGADRPTRQPIRPGAAAARRASGSPAITALRKNVAIPRVNSLWAFSARASEGRLVGAGVPAIAGGAFSARASEGRRPTSRPQLCLV